MDLNHLVFDTPQPVELRPGAELAAEERHKIHTVAAPANYLSVADGIAGKISDGNLRFNTTQGKQCGHKLNRRPYIDNRYNTLPRVWFGQGMAAKLRKIQTQTNVAFRQMADFGTLRNMPWGLYNPHSTGLLKPNALKPGAMVPVQDPRGVQFASFSGDHAFQVAWLQLLDRWAERDTALTDFSQGRTSSQPNAPRTARGTMALLQQSEIQFNHRVSLFVEAYKELFQQVHELHKFNSPEELPFRVLNRKFGILDQKFDHVAVAGVAHGLVIEVPNPPFEGLAQGADAPCGGERLVAYAVEREMFEAFEWQDVDAAAVVDRLARIAVFIDQPVSRPCQVVL